MLVFIGFRGMLNNFNIASVKNSDCVFMYFLF